jgi:hypothetical protein
VLGLIARVMPVARAISITMEMLVAIVILKGLCLSQVAQSGELDYAMISREIP